jgi:hypothetical protein
LRRLKILIHGQEVDTLAGHVDLTGFFDLNSAMLSAPQNAPAPASPQNAKPSATLALPATNPIAKPSH